MKTFHTRLSLIVLAAALLSTPSLAAEPWKPDGPIPADKATTTADIVDYNQARTKVWDARLTQAYKALRDMVKDLEGAAELGKQLITAQRLWIQYRDANCKFYWMGPGSISRIEASECMRRMTQDRAIELQDAGPH